MASNVTYNAKTNWVLNEIVYPEDTNKWEQGIKDVVALANALNTTDIPNIRTSIQNLENGRAKTDLSNLTTAASQRLVPIGSLMMSPLDTLDGYLLCNGQAVSRTTYAALFSKIGVDFGIGDGITTFNVPDYRGCFLRGLGEESAADTHTKQLTALPNITGKIDASGHAATAEAFGETPLGSPTVIEGALEAIAGYQDATPDSGGGTMLRGIKIDASKSSSVYQNGVTEARPTNFAINYFIKY